MVATGRLPYAFPAAAGGEPSACVARAAGADAADLRPRGADRHSPADSCRRRRPVVELHRGEPAEAGVAEAVAVLG
jgi:hypothetical protein